MQRERTLSREFLIKGKDGRKMALRAHDYKEFTRQAGEVSRTKTFRALREGKSFFMESDRNYGKNPDYHSEKDDLSRINVALEAMRNLNQMKNDDSSSMHLIFPDDIQVPFSSFLEAKKHETAEVLNSYLSAGVTLLVSGNKAKADSSKI